MIDKIWSRRYFEDVSVSIDSLCPTRDTAFFKIRVQERPRVSAWTFSGIKSGDQKDLKERLKLIPYESLVGLVLVTTSVIMTLLLT